MRGLAMRALVPEHRHLEAGTSTGGSTICDSLGQRLDDLSKIEPIPFRPQNAGADEIAQLTLRAGVVPQRSGFAAHVA